MQSIRLVLNGPGYSLAGPDAANDDDLGPPPPPLLPPPPPPLSLPPRCPSPPTSFWPEGSLVVPSTDPIGPFPPRVPAWGPGRSRELDRAEEAFQKAQVEPLGGIEAKKRTKTTTTTTTKKMKMMMNVFSMHGDGEDKSCYTVERASGTLRRQIRELEEDSAELSAESLEERRQPLQKLDINRAGRADTSASVDQQPPTLAPHACTRCKQKKIFCDRKTSESHSIILEAYSEKWAVITRAAKDQNFNTYDGGRFTYRSFCQRLAGWYGADWEGLVECTQYKEKVMPFIPRGYGEKWVSRIAFSLVDWAKQEKVQKAWKTLAEKFDLAQKELVDIDRVFGFADGSFTRVGSLMYSADKSRKFGWHGYVDVTESLLAVFDDMAKIKMIPPVPKGKVQSN